MRNGRKNDEQVALPEPETERDFFESVFDEASSSMRAGTRFAPDAIERTFAKVGGRR